MWYKKSIKTDRGIFAKIRGQFDPRIHLSPACYGGVWTAMQCVYTRVDFLNS
jgi:hypothetical protein